ncbi:MAG: exodeoxyribonuclease III [Endomicrobium sp.]|jgi:exodeoxyribonuclease-3|nr:exodeoxyribonuclease III [Endomicrobium sp.]
MKIVSWNINGIRAIYRKGFVNWLENENADIVCVQETKANRRQFPSDVSELYEYKLYCSSAKKKGYSGVAVWSKIEPKSVSTSIKNNFFDSEGRVICLDFYDFKLFNVYFPNGCASEERLRYKINFYDYFIEYINNFKNKAVIICGDYNTAHYPIDLANPIQNEKTSGFLSEERKRLDNLVSSGFVDTFRVFNKGPGNYTWWSYKTTSRPKNIGWRIDYFFTSKQATKHLKSANILGSILGSDHCPISIDIF